MTSLLSRLVRSNLDRFHFTNGVLLVIIYIIAFLTTYNHIGPGAFSLTILPVVVLSSSLGLWRGLLAAALFFPLNIALTLSTGTTLDEFLNPIFIFTHFILTVVGGVAGYLYDLQLKLKTELEARQQAVKDMKESERRYRTLFQGNNDAVLIIDLDLVYMAANPRAEQLLGYRVDELVRMHAKELIAENDWPQFVGHTEKLLLGGNVSVFERAFIHQDGREVKAEDHLMAVFDSDGSPRYFQSIVRDISERKEFEEQLFHLATHDPLTGLPNRRLFEELAVQSINQAMRNKHKNALLFLDVDFFKYINDTFGHEKGDSILLRLAENFKGCMRKSDVVARLAGDEFVFLLEEISGPEDAQAVAEKILDTVSKSLKLDEGQLNLSASLGISIFPLDGEDIASLLHCADQAMYQVKQGGKNGYRFYSKAHSEY